MRLTTCAASGYIIVHTSSNVLVLFFLTFAGTLVLFYMFVVLSRAALIALIFSTSVPFLRRLAQPCLVRCKRIAWYRCRTCVLCCTCWGLCGESYRGRFIISGRLLLLTDIAVSLAFGAVLDASAAIMRITIALVAGLLRAAFIARPVVPNRFAASDSAFLFYGSMLKARHAALLDTSLLPSRY